MAFYIACLPSSLVELNSTATMGSDFVWSLNVFDRSHQWSHLFSTALRSQIPSILHAPCHSIWAHYSPRIYATRKGNEAGLSTSGRTYQSHDQSVPPAGGQRRGASPPQLRPPSRRRGSRTVARAAGGALDAWVGFPGGGGAPSGELGRA